MKSTAHQLTAVRTDGAVESRADLHHDIVTCERCPRLRNYCRQVGRDRKRAHRDETYWARPVPGFGDPQARLLIVGLAPAAHGANRTGRVFTGDGIGASGDFLMGSLHRQGFANIPTSRAVDDGLELRDAYVTATVRCAPPENKPRPEEITRCLDFLERELAQLPHVRVVVALGKLGFDAWIQLLRRGGTAPSPRPRFGHGAVARFELKHRRTGGQDEQGEIVPATLLGCYHPSRQNTNTGVLTPQMMDDVFREARRLIAACGAERRYRADLTSLRQGYGGPPELQRRRKVRPYDQNS